MVRELARPATVAEALQAASRPGAAFLGGGTQLASLAEGPEVLVSLARLGLDRIAVSADGVSFGAMVSLQRLVDSAEAPAGLREAAALTASRTLRCMATLGGELGARLADSALVTALVAMGAAVRLASRRQPRPVEDWCRTPSRDLVLELLVPAGADCGVRAVSRTSHGPRSLVVAVSRIGPRIVANDCKGQVFRLVELEEALAGKMLASREEILGAVERSFFPTPDIHASAEYKRRLAGILVARLMGARP